MPAESEGIGSGGNECDRGLPTNAGIGMGRGTKGELFAKQYQLIKYSCQTREWRSGWRPQKKQPAAVDPQVEDSSQTMKAQH